MLPPQPVSMLMLRSAARDRKPESRMRQAQFIQRELIARRAHILTLLHFMPEPLADEPAVGQLAEIYWERLRGLLEGPASELETAEHVARFAELQARATKHIAAAGTALEEQTFLAALKPHGRFWATHPAERLAVDHHLDQVFLARIGLRCLLEHYVACDAPPRDGFVGIVETHCSPVALCREVRARAPRVASSRAAATARAPSARTRKARAHTQACRRARAARWPTRRARSCAASTETRRRSRWWATRRARSRTCRCTSARW